MEIKTITGQDIKHLRTLKTQYDNNRIIVTDDKDNQYYIKIEEIMKFNTDFNNIIFNVVKKRVHNYLEVKEVEQ